MFSAIFREIRSQLHTLNQLVRTREFWIYVFVILCMALVAAAAMMMATSFDPLTRGQLGLRFSCKTGDGQLATIIVGSMVFAMACLFTLGEVVNWVEETRMSRAPGRRPYKVSFWRPLLHVLGTVALGISGYVLMRIWCS